jgi:hypothetical protein
MADHPNIRNSKICPVCSGDKRRNLVTCWPCYNKYNLRNGNQTINAMIDQVEIALEGGK